MKEFVHEKLSLLGNGFTNTDMPQLLEDVKGHIEDAQRARLVFLNVDVVIKAEKDAYLRQIIDEAEYVLADGMPLIWISRLFKSPLKEKISGSDFVPLLCRQAAKSGHSVYFVGGKDEVAKRAVKKVQETCPGIRIAGSSSPPFGFENDPAEIEKLNLEIRSAAPDILIVCLGCPKQERFVYENQERYKVPVSVCAGATIDFLAGSKKRCPPWMSRWGLEWFYRFMQEPGRLFKRYFVDDIQILGLILKYRKDRSLNWNEKKAIIRDKAVRRLQ